MKLTEAFRALNALNEDTFSVADDGIAKLAEFEQNDDVIDDISVIDTEAETEDDLEDSYIGKVILDCTVCHSKLYKDVEEIELDEEQTLANVGEECPYCYTSDGFKVMGQVAAFGGKSEEADDDNADDTKPEDDDVDIDTAADVKDDDATADDDDAVKESLDESLLEAPVATLERPMSAIGGTLSNVMADHSDELSNVYDKASAIGFLDSIEPEVKNKGYLQTIKAKLAKMPDSRAAQFLYNIILKGDGMGTKMESIKEDVNNVNVETDDSIVNVNTDDSGKVTVTTEPKTIEEAPAEGAEVITPLTDETEEAILNNDSDIPADDEFVDVEMDEFDEETFDGLGEGYLKKVYENVQSYKTTSSSMKDDKLFVEGMITFNSGAQKKTSFIFEAKDFTKSGKYRLIGENTQLTRGRKAFTIKGRIDEGKFITESFNYNYKAKDTDGNSTRIYGTIKG